MGPGRRGHTTSKPEDDSDDVSDDSWADAQGVRLRDGDSVSLPDGRMGCMYGDPYPEEGCVSVLFGEGRKANVHQIPLGDLVKVLDG